MSKAVAKQVEQVPAPASSGIEIAPLIERIMTDPSIPIDRVEQAFSFYQKVEEDRARKAWMSAFVAACNDIEPVLKDKNNKETKSKFASHPALDAMLRPIYTAHGFAPTFDTTDSPKPDHIRVVMTLIHKDGFERDYHIDMAADGKGPKGGAVMTLTHAAGSAISHAKRYLLIAAFNLQLLDKPSDDDGNAAGGTSEDREALLAKMLALADEKNVSRGVILERFSVAEFEDLTAKQINAAIAGLAKTRVQ